MAIQGDEANMMLNDLLVAVGNSQFPGDLMMLILSRLPVKSIVRFKSVCRAWFALFICPMFIQQQCRIASSSAKINNLLSLFVHTDNLKLGNPIFYLLVDRSCGEHTSMLLNPPFECDLHAIQVVGSINGLVCLDFSNKGTSIVLWNPATRKHWRIPNPNMWFSSKYAEESVSVGFAYDDKTDTYKVIRTLVPSSISNLSLDGTYINTVEIYSSGTNTWRTIEAGAFPWCFKMKFGTVVSGSAYWYTKAIKFLPEKYLAGLVVWFDPSTEGFRFHTIPCEGTIYEKIGMSAIAEHPVVYYETFRREKDETVTLLDIWILHTCDDGVQNGDYTIDGESMTIEFVSSSRLRSALGFTGNGEIVALSESAELFICDPHSGQCQLIHHTDAAWGWQPKVYDYSESLVSPFRAA